MAVDALGTISPLARLQPLAPPQSAEGENSATGFAGVLNNLMAGNQQANAAADAAIRDLATGQAQDLHTVTMAVAQAEISFRFILEMRNRLSDAYQEITRMQV